VVITLTAVKRKPMLNKKERKGNKFMALDLGNPAIIRRKRKLHGTKKA
jgi:hypothetical protein